VAENIKITIEAEDKASPVLSSIQSSLSNLNRNVSSNTSAMSSSFSALNRSLGNLETAFSAVAGAFFVKETVSFVNNIQTLDNKLRLVTNSTAELNSTYDQLYKVSLATRQGLAPTIDLYSKLALNAEQVGLKQSDLTTIVEVFNKTLLKSGASTQGAASSIYQLGQAMASGKLQGDEFRSIIETNSAFMITLARTTGLSQAQLKLFAKEGLLTSSLLAQAMKDDLSTLNKEIDKMPKTLGQSVTGLSNAFQRTVRDILDTTDGANLMSRAVDALAANIKPLTYAMVALTAAFTIAALIKAVVFVVEAFTVAALGATVAVRGLSTALVFLASTPLGRIISLIGVGVGALATFGSSQDAAGKSTSYLSQGIDWLGKKLGITSTEAKTTTQSVGSFEQQIIDANDAQQKGLPISTEMAALLKKLGIEARVSQTPMDQLTASIDEQITTSKLFSDERKRSGEVQKALDKVIEDSRKQGIFFTDTEVANAKTRIEAKFKERDENTKATDELEKRYKDYLSFIKSSQDKNLSETDKFNKDVFDLEEHRRKNSRMSEEEYQGVLDSIRTNYSEKYKKLIVDQNTTNLTNEQKFQKDLNQLNEDNLAGRLDKNTKYEEVLAALRQKYSQADMALQKAAKESLMTEQDKFDAAMLDAQTKLNIGLYANQDEYQKQVDALKTNYLKKYRDMEKTAQDMRMDETDKYTKALKQIEDYFLKNRFASYDQYTKAKESADIIHNKKLWDEAEKYRIQEGGAFAAYQQTLSELQKAQLAGRFQNEGQYQTLVREATRKLNDDVASTYSTMYTTVSTKLLEMLGVNKEKWPQMKEVIKLFGFDSDAILKDLFRQGIQYVLGFTNPGGTAVTTFGGVIGKIFGNGGTAPQAVSQFGTGSQSVFSQLVSGGTTLFNSLGNAIVSTFSTAYNGITRVFSSIGSFLNTNVLSLLDDIIDGAASAVSSLAKVVTGGGGGGGGGGSWIDDAISIGSAIFSFFSDERTKKNIKYKETAPNGINLYDFQYRSPYSQIYGSDVKTGVIAQDVIHQVPGAVSKNSNGMYQVNYGMLGIPSSKLRFAKGGIIGSPTTFGMGLAGEAGPEAILPLSRSSGGELGVKADMTGMQMAPINISFTINAVDSRGIDTLLIEKKSLITNIVRGAVQQRGVKI